MTEWRNAVANALDDFVVVAALAGNQLNDDELFVEYLEMPHPQPKRLPPGKMAVYGFWGFGEWLKAKKQRTLMKISELGMGGGWKALEGPGRALEGPLGVSWDALDAH